jgi:hypothetical protein
VILAPHSGSDAAVGPMADIPESADRTLPGR